MMKDPRDLERKSSVPQGGDNLNWSQKWSKPVRPQNPSDSTQGGQPKWETGTMPKGGYRSVFCFEDGNYSTKISKTSGGGKKVY
jgi:hypothetical protein